MRLDLNRESEYAIRALVVLAIDGDRPLSGREIAGRIDVPERYLSRVLAELGWAGIVTSRIGRSGGYVLGRDPERLSLLEVVESVEGPARSRRCVLRQQGAPICHAPSTPVGCRPDGVINTLGDHRAAPAPSSSPLGEPSRTRKGKDRHMRHLIARPTTSPPSR
jgi:Rrf2 family protein